MNNVAPPLRACSSRRWGEPCHSSADTSTSVSTTIRTPPAFRTRGFHFGVDLVHRHRWNVGCGSTVGDGQQRITGTLAFKRILEQALQRLRGQQSRLAGSLGRRIGKVDL